MSYERNMLEKLDMPTREEVERSLLITMFKNNGIIKEFAKGVDIVSEIANELNLNVNQRTAILERIYHKENRIVKSLLWHRLLFRAADSLAKQKLITRPSATIQLTNKKEWMLTEIGYDLVLKYLRIPEEKKSVLNVKSFEVQKIVKKLIESPRPKDYLPFDKGKKMIKSTRESILRKRGFRQAVIEAYNYKCAFCGLKINSPNSSNWEVEAAHIVPNSLLGKDDVLNALALCRLHHWAFDVGWLSLQDNFQIEVSNHINSLNKDFGIIGNYDFIRVFCNNSNKIFLPNRKDLYPHENSIRWHRENRFAV